MLIRAILGCKKAVNKLALCMPSDKKQKTATPRKEIGIQCNERERYAYSGDLDGIFQNPVDAKLLSDILQRLESLTNNKMTTRLIDIYRSLNRMHTEVPLLSEMPDMNYFEPDKIVDEIQQNLSEVHREIANYIAKRSLARNKWEIGVQCDVRPENEKEKEIMLNIAKEKEIENLRLNTLLKKHIIEIDNLKDQVAKEQLRSNALEEQMNILDFSLRAAKSKESKSQETTESAKNNLKETLKKLEDMLEMIRKYRRDLNTTESQMKKIYNTLLQWDDELFETKINYRVAEEKLKQIEKAYTEKVGKPFEYAPVTREEVIQKYNILKRQFDFPWMGTLKQKQVEREAIETGMTGITGEKEDDFIHAYFESNRSSMQSVSDPQSSNYGSIKGSVVPGIYLPPSRPQLSTSRLDVYSRKTIPAEFRTQEYREYRESSESSEFKEDRPERGNVDRFGVDYRGRNLESPDVGMYSSSTGEKRAGSISRLVGREEEDSKYKFDRPRFYPNDTLESVMEYATMSTIESRVSLENCENSESKCTVEIRELNTEEVLALLASGKQLDGEQIKLIQRWIKKSNDKFASFLPPDLRKMFFTIKKVESKLDLAKKAWYVSRNTKDTQNPVHGVGTGTENSHSHFSSNSKERDASSQRTRSKTTGPAGNLSRGSASPFSANRRSPRSSVLEELHEGEHPSVRKLISKIMMGHDNRCGAQCLHLKRAMALKARYRGNPYPVNTTNIEFVEPPELEEL